MLGRKAHIFDLVYVAEVGSTIYGTGVGEDDLDVTAVRFEGWREFVNGPLSRQSMMVRSKPDQAPSEPGDIDINLYTLRKFAMLAAKGNPSILTALYSPNSLAEIDFSPLRKYIRSLSAGRAYHGYLTSQKTKLLKRTYPSRQALIDEHGFDTKSAYHAVRLGMQGHQYMRDGELEIPFTGAEAKFLLDIRKGRFHLDEVLDFIDDVADGLDVAIAQSGFPERADIVGIEHWLSGEYRLHFN